MNDQLKQKLEEAGKNYVASFGGEIPVSSKATKDNFVSGAQWLHDQGYRFTEDDMRAAYRAGAEDEYTERTFDKWLKERSKQ